MKHTVECFQASITCRKQAITLNTKNNNHNSYQQRFI